MRESLFVQANELPFGDALIVDMRPRPVADAFPHIGTINIPLPTLRANLNKLDRSNQVITVCAFGRISHFAKRLRRMALM